MPNKESSDDETDCPQCKEGPEYYRMVFNLYKFDVDLARTIVADGREKLLLDDEDLSHALEWATIHLPHLEHVDLKYPGIVAHYWYPEEDGSLLQGQVLIDGHHRGAKAQREGVPFFIYLLTEVESRQVTMRAPDLETILKRRYGRPDESDENGDST